MVKVIYMKLRLIFKVSIDNVKMYIDQMKVLQMKERLDSEGKSVIDKCLATYDFLFSY